MKKTYKTPELQVEGYEIDSETGICASGMVTAGFFGLTAEMEVSLGTGVDGIEDGE